MTIFLAQPGSFKIKQSEDLRPAERHTGACWYKFAIWAKDKQLQTDLKSRAQQIASDYWWQYTDKQMWMNARCQLFAFVSKKDALAFRMYLPANEQGYIYWVQGHNIYPENYRTQIVNELTRR